MQSLASTWPISSLQIRRTLTRKLYILLFTGPCCSFSHSVQSLTLSGDYCYGSHDFSGLYMSQHTPTLGLLGLDLGLPVFSLIFSFFLYSSC
ncbi:uncharacterized protein EV420DRAFT_1556007 [Desarmillaria tabescens]|uniref:Uncharacterized protein n=1 Tax=Armillaria tabescens TaxID=1929756 RepID=A0AA39K6D5_ARMTA|nr:uncharacterized protein EV420DRAFT_1556007 [Desarmillaria tabescens]KAK0454275.1 hypothetical protein EV420DRAFT_1556007 [Desarmillaria tabescens]